MTLALTGLVFEASDGQSLVTADVEHAFLVTAVFLGAVALAAGLIAGWPEIGAGGARGPRA